MSYPYPPRGRYPRGEVLVLQKAADCATTASGVVNHTMNVPPGAYKIGVSFSTEGAGASATVKVWAFQTPQQDTQAAALSTALDLIAHGAAAAATVLTVPTTTTYGGTSGQLVPSTTLYGNGNFVAPFGLLVQTTCNTDSGSYDIRLICQAVS